MKKAFVAAFLAALAAMSMHAIVSADITSGKNFNVNPGVVDQFVGDVFLQRKVEPKGAISGINAQHVLVLANDYRTVDFAADTGVGEGNFVATIARWFGLSPKAPIAAPPPDAWMGVYRSYDGAEKFWNGLWPGFPTDATALGQRQPHFGLAAGSDAGVAADGYGRFHVVALFFNRGGTSMIVADRLTDYNDESKHPIRWDDKPRVLVQGSANSRGRFADLPSVVWDTYRGAGPASNCSDGRPGGHVYIGYTLFHSNNNSSIYFSGSNDCGQTYSAPRKINGGLKNNQRVVMAVDRRPTNQGGGALYAVWRSFQPDQIVYAKSIDQGRNWTGPFPITQPSGPPVMCVYDVPSVGTDAGFDNETARALAFPSAQVGPDGRLHVFWPERVDSNTGLPLAAQACAANFKTTLPRIVHTMSLVQSPTSGSPWKQRKAIDVGNRCEKQTPHPAGPFEVPPLPNGDCPATAMDPEGQQVSGFNQRSAGPQFMQAAAFNAGRLFLSYKEGREAKPPLQGFLGPQGFHRGRDSQLDVRATEIDPATGLLIATRQVSQYTISIHKGDIIQVEEASNPPNSKAYNRPYLPQYKGGLLAFQGDHDDLFFAEQTIEESPVRWATEADVPAARAFALWGGDTRNAHFPGGPGAGDLFSEGGWGQYSPPGTGEPPSCNAGIKYSTNYIAYVGPRIDAFAHQPYKGLGMVQRSWPITIRNRSAEKLIVKLAVAEKDGFELSFDQFTEVDVIGNNDQDPFCVNGQYPTCTARRTILPHSSMTFTAFGTGPDTAVANPFSVLIDDVGTGLNPDAIVRLNPNSSNPAPLAGTGIANEEHHGPHVIGPFVKTHQATWKTNNTNPTGGNPTGGNPTGGNPTGGNPTGGNPTGGNVTAGNAGLSEYTDYAYVVQTTPDTNTVSAFSVFANIASATADHVDQSHLTQLIITKTHLTPTANLATNPCAVKEKPEDEVISVITVPKSSHLGVPTGGNPTGGNPTGGNPTGGNPTGGNPTGGNNTLAIPPVDAEPLGPAAAANFRATAVAALRQAFAPATEIGPDGTVVAKQLPYKVLAIARFWHCRAAGGCGSRPEDNSQIVQEQPGTEAVPRDEQELAAKPGFISFVAIGEAGDCVGATCTPPRFDGAGPDLTISSPMTLTTSPTMVIGGEYTTVAGFTIANQGDAAAGPFSYRFFLSTDSVITPQDVPLTPSTPIEGLAAGGSQLVDPEAVLIPENTAPNTYWVGPFVDDTDAVSEIDEFNNSKSAQIVVVAPQLVWTVQPNDTRAGKRINAAPKVKAVHPRDQSGISGINVSVAIQTNPTTATLFGTTTGMTDEGGTFTFSNIWIDKTGTSSPGNAAVGNGYTLVASSTRPYVSPVASSAFNILAKTILVYGPVLASSTPNEQTIASGQGYTVTNKSASQWSSTTSDEFKTFNAIVFPDPECVSGPPAPSTLDAAVNNKATWSGAVDDGPQIVIGTDPQWHVVNVGAKDASATATKLIRQSINFAAREPDTGLYVALSCYYEFAETDTTVTLLDGLEGPGAFKVRGAPSNAASITTTGTTHPATTGISNDDISGWGVSVHEKFFQFPGSWFQLATENTAPAKPYIISNRQQ